MSKIKGSDLMLFIDDRSIAYATNHTIEINGESTDNKNKDEGVDDWSYSEINKLSWNCSTENLFSYDGQGNLYDKLEMLMILHRPINIVMSVKYGNITHVPNGGWYPRVNWNYSGKVIITDLSMNAPNGDYSTFTCQFEGVGQLYKTFTSNANINDPDPVSCDDPDTFILEQDGAAYNMKVYYNNIRRIDGSFSDRLANIKYHIDDWNDVTENGLQVGDRIHIINLYFQLNDELRTVEYGDIYGVVKALDSTNNIIELKPDDIFKNYIFVNTDFEYDMQSDYQDLMTDGVQLPIEDYPWIIDGQYVHVLLNHHYEYLWGKVSGQINDNWKIIPYFITD